MQILADEDQELRGRFLPHARQAGGEQRRAHIGVADLLSPGGEAGKQAFLLRRDSSQQKRRQQTGFERAFIPEDVCQFERKLLGWLLPPRAVRFRSGSAPRAACDRFLGWSQGRRFPLSARCS